MSGDNGEPLLRLDTVSVALRQSGVEMVSDVSFSVARRELFGIVGESGSGKTLFTRAVLGLHDDAMVSGGDVVFDGRTIPAARHRAEMKRFLGKRIGFIPQDPFSSLNPSMRVGAQITESIHLSRGIPTKSRRAREAAIAVLNEVGIPEPEIAFRQYPDQFSGGMRQRIVIAIALVQQPELLVADEPTTALDASTQRLIVDLIVERSRNRDVAVILISHNLELLRQSMDRIGVLYSGQFLNLIGARDLTTREVHPYTQALFDCLPSKDRTLADIKPIPGEPAGAGFGSRGCAFAERCSHTEDRCRVMRLPLNDPKARRFSACILGKGA